MKIQLTIEDGIPIPPIRHIWKISELTETIKSEFEKMEAGQSFLIPNKLLGVKEDDKYLKATIGKKRSVICNALKKYKANANYITRMELDKKLHPIGIRVWKLSSEPPKEIEQT